MSKNTEMDPEIERIANEVLDEHNQSEAFKSRFVNFYQNAVQNNLSRNSLEKLIKQVEIPEGDELNGSQNQAD